METTTHDRPAARASRSRTLRANLRRYWLAWGLFLVFSAVGFMRALDAWTDWSWLSLAGVQPGPLYFIVIGLLWGVVSLGAAVWLLFGLPRSRQVGLSAALFMALTFWLDRLLFSRAPGSGGNTPFALLATLLLLGLAARAFLPAFRRPSAN